MKSEQIIKEALQLIFNTVCPSLGPNGKYVFINDGYRSFVTKDGATIVKYLHSNDKQIQTVLDIISQASLKTNETVGDGTTSSLLYAYYIYKYFMSTKDKSVSEFKKFKKLFCSELEKVLNDNLNQIESKEQLINIANISCAGDEEIANNIGELVWNLRDTGIIEILESKDSDYHIEYASGVKYQAGYVSPIFITNAAKRTVEIYNPYIVISTEEIRDFKVISDAYNEAKSFGKPLLVLAPKFSDEVLDLAYLNINQGLKFYLSYFPGFGETRIDNANDLNIILFNKEYLTCDKVIITRDEIQFINPGGDKLEKEARSIYLQQQIDNTEDEAIRNNLIKRRANLNGKSGKLFVPANTKAELDEKIDRIEDAICATKAALESGFVVGGGYILRKLVYSSNYYKSFEEICNNVIGYIYRDIVFGNPIVIGEDFITNLSTNEKENISDTVVIEPVNVVKESITNAFSIVELLINCYSIIWVKPITL